MAERDCTKPCVKKVLELILEGVLKLAGPLGEQLMAILKKGGEVFNKIVEDPIACLRNLQGGQGRV